MEHSPQHQKDSGPAAGRIPFLSRVIATGFFSGYIPWASGTFGSLVGLLIYLIPGVEQAPVLALLTAAGLVAGAVTADQVARVVGDQLTATARAAKDAFQGGHAPHPDPSIVVIDEIVGMWISLLLLPKTVLTTALAFFFFRAYDILKPPPARQLERVPRGWGIMLDDVAAGIYANLSVRVVKMVVGLGM
jgi:phosphatidylglycerophosphatase A